MCDTLYAGSAISLEGHEWFAKNSDRNPAESQSLCIVPAGPSAPELSFALSKPSWMEGGEMGVNQMGVAIGNEAVFSRFAAKKDGVLGMAILREALSRSRTAAEARDFICDFVGRRDQGGNGAYKGSLVYSNSFLVSGTDGAFVIETAARRWAWKTVKSFASISNAYSIENDYDAVDEMSKVELSGSGRSWRALVEERLHLFFTKGDDRRNYTSGVLGAAAPSVDFPTIAAALRGHSAGGRSMSGPCLHDAGFPIKSSTTASMIFERDRSGGASGILWFTGTPYPCLSVFAPLLLTEDGFVPLWDGYDYSEGSKGPLARWELARKKALERGGVTRASDPDFVAARERVQKKIAVAAHEAAAAPRSKDSLAEARREIDAAMAAWEPAL